MQKEIENWNDRMHMLNVVHDNSVKSIEKRKERQAGYYNENKRENIYEIGQKVWKKNTKLSSAADGYSAKFGALRVGPYEIGEQLGDNTYKIMLNGVIEPNPWHARQFMPHIEPAQEFARVQNQRKSILQQSKIPIRTGRRGRPCKILQSVNKPVAQEAGVAGTSAESPSPPRYNTRGQAAHAKKNQ